MSVRSVTVEAPARLHFGVLDLRGSLGRWFGGVGTAAPGPSLRLSMMRADDGVIECSGDGAERAEEFADRFNRANGISTGARIRIERALPRHVGLGSGTQLALAVARGLAELHGLDTNVTRLSRSVGRADRSAVGCWVFDGGGLVIEGGRREHGAPAPLLARIPFPASWQCVVAVPEASPGLNGAAETASFAQLPAPPEGEAARMSHLVLMALLPALVEADLPAFGKALSGVQELTGRWFAPIQGGTFAPGPTRELVEQLRSWGAHGVGQSSWGPTVYGIVEGDYEAEQLAARLRHLLAGRGCVYHGPFHTEGARVWHG